MAVCAALAFAATTSSLACNGAQCAPMVSKCAVCEALMEAVDRQIEEKEDAEEGGKVAVGWRMDGKGGRIQRFIPWVRSEEGIAKTLDSSCRTIMNLTESTRGDGSINLFMGPSEHFRLGGAKLDMYMRTCFAFVEEFEEELVEALSADSADRPLPRLVRRMCTQASAYCPSSRWEDDPRFSSSEMDGKDAGNTDEASRGTTTAESKDELR